MSYQPGGASKLPGESERRRKKRATTRICREKKETAAEKGPLLLQDNFPECSDDLSSNQGPNYSVGEGLRKGSKIYLFQEKTMRGRKKISCAFCARCEKYKMDVSPSPIAERNRTVLKRRLARGLIIPL